MSRKLRRALVTASLSASLPWLAACAHPITTHMVANRFDSPEVSGALLKGDFGGGLEGGNQWTITQDLDQNPPDFSRNGFDRSDDDAFLGVGVGLLSRLDAEVKLRFNTTTIGELKYQILGDPRITAKKGNFSLAVTAGGGGSTRDESNQTDTLLDPNVVASDTITETDIDFGAIAGYRPVDQALIYAGSSFTRRVFSGSITQSVSSTGPVIFPFNGQVEQAGFNLGFMAGGAPGGTGSPLYAKLEYAFAWNWSQGIDAFGGYLGGEVGFTW